MRSATPLVATALAVASAAHLPLRDAASAQVDVWGQCGGKEYKGDTSCTRGNICKSLNEWYSQCQPGGDDQVGAWGQCGGKDYKGATKCTHGNDCKAWNEWYSQCIPGTKAPNKGTPQEVPLNWVQVSNVCYSKVDGDHDTAVDATSFEDCVNQANTKGKLYATWKDNKCTVLSTVYSYTMDNACKGAAKYDLDKYSCAGNTDFYGSDIGNAQTRFDRCLDSCQYYTANGNKCNAVMWVRNPGSEFGVCFFKSFTDFNRKPSTSWLGGISCKRNPE